MAAMTMSTKTTTMLSTNMIIITTSTRRIAFPKYLETSSKTAPDMQRVQDAMPRAFLPQSLSLHPKPPSLRLDAISPHGMAGFVPPHVPSPTSPAEPAGAGCVHLEKRAQPHVRPRRLRVYSPVHRNSTSAPETRIAIASHTLGRVVELQDHLGGIACQMSLRDVN